MAAPYTCHRVRLRCGTLTKCVFDRSSERQCGMTPETYYTIRRIQSPCGSRLTAVFDLTYRRVWRPELGDEGEWCDFLVQQKEVETGQLSALATT